MNKFNKYCLINNTYKFKVLRYKSFQIANEISNYSKLIYNSYDSRCTMYKIDEECSLPKIKNCLFYCSNNRCYIYYNDTWYYKTDNLYHNKFYWNNDFIGYNYLGIMYELNILSKYTKILGIKYDKIELLRQDASVMFTARGNRNNRLHAYKLRKKWKNEN